MYTQNDMDMATDAIRFAHAENAQLRAALRALVWPDGSGLCYQKPVTRCVYCDNFELFGDDGAPFDHAPNCPIRTARDLFGGGGAHE